MGAMIWSRPRPRQKLAFRYRGFAKGGGSGSRLWRSRARREQIVDHVGRGIARPSSEKRRERLEIVPARQQGRLRPPARPHLRVPQVGHQRIAQAPAPLRVLQTAALADVSVHRLTGASVAGVLLEPVSVPSSPQAETAIASTRMALRARTRIELFTCVSLIGQR